MNTLSHALSVKTYISKTTQNELILSMGDFIRDQIVVDIKDGISTLKGYMSHFSIFLCLDIVKLLGTVHKWPFERVRASPLSLWKAELPY